jgi:hypothetical protein
MSQALRDCTPRVPIARRSSRHIANFALCGFMDRAKSQIAPKKRAVGTRRTVVGVSGSSGTAHRSRRRLQTLAEHRRASWNGSVVGFPTSARLRRARPARGLGSVERRVEHEELVGALELKVLRGIGGRERRVCRRVERDIELSGSAGAHVNVSEAERIGVPDHCPVQLDGQARGAARRMHEHANRSAGASSALADGAPGSSSSAAAAGAPDAPGQLRDTGTRSPACPGTCSSERPSVSVVATGSPRTSTTAPATGAVPSWEVASTRTSKTRGPGLAQATSAASASGLSGEEAGRRSMARLTAWLALEAWPTPA